jgi:hypothetical protein
MSSQENLADRRGQQVEAEQRQHNHARSFEKVFKPGCHDDWNIGKTQLSCNIQSAGRKAMN